MKIYLNFLRLSNSHGQGLRQADFVGYLRRRSLTTRSDLGEFSNYRARPLVATLLLTFSLVFSRDVASRRQNVAESFERNGEDKCAPLAGQNTAPPTRHDFKVSERWSIIAFVPDPPGRRYLGRSLLEDNPLAEKLFRSPYFGIASTPTSRAIRNGALASCVGQTIQRPLHAPKGPRPNRDEP
jgi:hypothetical protein